MGLCESCDVWISASHEFEVIFENWTTRCRLLRAGSLDIRKAFIVYLISYDRPIHEILRANFQNIDIIFERGFLSMTSEPIALDVLNKIRESLVEPIHSVLTSNEKEFLISFKHGDPNWALLGITGPFSKGGKSRYEISFFRIHRDA